VAHEIDQMWISAIIASIFGAGEAVEELLEEE